MHTSFYSSFFWAGLIALACISCQNDEVQAEESLEGIWDIVSLTSYYGEFSETRFDASETVSESGQLGTFEFVQDSVAYSFTRNDTAYAGNVAWVLELEKVRSGFSRENQFTLTVEDRFVFNVSFEDETRNAEKDATTTAFVTIPEEGSSVFLELSLEKR